MANSYSNESYSKYREHTMLDQSVNGKFVCMRMNQRAMPVDFSLWVGEVEVRKGRNPRALSEWALAAGAKEVAWKFDLGAAS